MKNRAPHISMGCAIKSPNTVEKDAGSVWRVGGGVRLSRFHLSAAQQSKHVVDQLAPAFNQPISVTSLPHPQEHIAPNVLFEGVDETVTGRSALREMNIAGGFSGARTICVRKGNTCQHIKCCARIPNVPFGVIYSLVSILTL